MDFSEVRSKVRSALDCLLLRDASLLELNGSEWAVAHRLAVYLEHLFPEWSVDCEYHRQGMDGDIKVNEAGRHRRPDISIHRRGKIDLDSNLLVIELKKVMAGDAPVKVKEFTASPAGLRHFQYRFGLALVIQPAPHLQWFMDGVELRG
jgi:hypothetical protein